MNEFGGVSFLGGVGVLFERGYYILLSQSGGSIRGGHHSAAVSCSPPAQEVVGSKPSCPPIP